ncbi:uncharacterized protein F4812DRAFT_7356 [Daldinia caldariorum]|uniref:uncharacterized protein n=1 Tax=Daldinia caldariorum TaxID=326644 RepID=UPI002007E04F|nr:uncharacterized protein F4812DRAFT_7356 [Daldinia caldariorum]KAI1472286.1 hypothetical protein F4812DRAFT_7356 [Daldinia caldariorum]
MADLLRQSRPWLLSPMRLRALRAPSPITCTVYRSISTTPSRPYAARRGGNRSRTMKSFRQGNQQQMEPSMTMLIPQTLVAPPLWRYPRQPSKFFQMLWLHIKTRYSALWAIMSMKVMSQPTPFISRPLFKFHRAAAIPTAKALHVQMSEAMALGDKETLRSICTPELFQTLAATIDARPRGIRAEWELVRYASTWLYPRVADWRTGYQPLPNGDMKALKQIVVSIASVQRIARYDDSKGGVKVPGSERVRKMVEHIVLQAAIDKNTYEAEPWKIWGTLPETTYEEYRAELENYQAVMSEQPGK